MSAIKVTFGERKGKRAQKTRGPKAKQLKAYNRQGRS